MNRYAIILAAGQGTRMKSKRHKLLHHVCGKPIIRHAVDAVLGLGVTNIVTIVGHGSEEIKAALGDCCKYAFQAEQLGTAHAVMQAKPFLGEHVGLTIVMNGDAPAMNSEMLESLIAMHQEQAAKATILTERIENPRSYGRIIRNELGHVEKIVEAKDASPEEYAVKEINTGTFCFDNQTLFEALKEVDSHNAQQELYLTDVIEILRKKGEIVAAYCTDDLHGATGVNDRIDLALAERVVGDRVKEFHMKNGVTIVDPASTTIHLGVKIGSDTTICPGTIITGNTVIGENCVIGPNSEIHHCQVGDASIIRHSVATDSVIGSHTTVGPFAHLRPAAQLGNHVKVGNFVEVKKSTIDENSKVSHLSYIGDAKMGKGVNIGCGTITVNYDGKNKYVTEIEDGAFIGCNVNMIAPVTIGKNSIVAAGSTITENVPEDALAIAREKQTNKEGYANKIREKQ